MVNAGKALFSPSRSASFEQFILDSRGDTDTLIRYLQLRLSTAVQNPATRRRKTRPGGSGLRHGARAYQ